MHTQLTIDGREVPLDKLTFRPLTSKQEAIMRHARTIGYVTSAEAALIMDWQLRENGRSDRSGQQALRRLAKRGLLEQSPMRYGRRKVWHAR
jgi:hypothetical protein